ncbi:MAG: hypothetical protein M3P53_07985, partial [Actinomycetota bacterium]|nr:hypothetical protein [Actinomycetota bacterium]
MNPIHSLRGNQQQREEDRDRADPAVDLELPMDQAGASSGSQASGMTIASPATAMPTIVNSVVTGARATKVSIIAASTIHTTGVSTSKRKPKRLRAASAVVGHQPGEP